MDMEWGQDGITALPLELNEEDIQIEYFTDVECASGYQFDFPDDNENEVDDIGVEKDMCWEIDMIIQQKLEFLLKAWSLSHVKTEFQVAYNNLQPKERKCVCVL